MTYPGEDNPWFESRSAFDFVFKIFINIICLNIIFGIIVDTYSSLKKTADNKASILNSVCLVCEISKVELEANGVDFIEHITVQHSVDDYMAYMIRLRINDGAMGHTDIRIKRNIESLDVSWIPSKSSLYSSNHALTRTKRGGSEGRGV